MFAPVYLDHNATTPVHPLVLEAMLPFFDVRYGNASSRHEYGRAARKAVDEARQRVAAAVGAHPTEVVFTSGGSESNNLFLKGAAECMRPGLVAVSAVEHPCVREPAKLLAKAGWQMQEIAVDEAGCVEPSAYAELVKAKPALVSIMLANNETGVMQDLSVLAEAAKPSRAWFHTDAVQALGKIAVNFREFNAAGVHGLTVSGHKIGGPKGAGALVLDKRVELQPLISGGGHERGLRSGTENVPAIVGFGVACELAVADLENKRARLQAMRDDVEQGLDVLGAVVFGREAERLPNTTYFAFPDLDGETLVGKLDRAGFAVASGAACSSANPEPSYVLTSMGVEPGLARGAVRVSLGASNTEADVKNFLAALEATVGQLKRLTAIAV